MKTNTVRLRARRLVLGLVLLVSGCGNWVAHRGPPGQLGAIEDLERIRITRRDSTVVVLERPTFAADSVFGMVRRSGQPDSLALATSDIARLERWRDETVAGASLIAGAGLLLVYALVTLPWDEDF